MTTRSCTLANGLRFVHAAMADTHMMALDVLYKVGSRDEPPTLSGYAHLLEHLLFSGTALHPNYDSEIQNAGGESNAFTTNDYTSYYVTLPVCNAETAFLLEADRMRGVLFTDESVEIQKRVVIEEFKQRVINQPYGDVQHLLRPLGYRVHPYCRPTIGTDIDLIARATTDDVRSFFQRFYTPSNAIVAVAGGISFDEARCFAEKYFGSIPPAESTSAHVCPEEPRQERMRRLTVHRPVPQDMLNMDFHMVSRSHPDFFVCDLISDLLANGTSSRLQQQLVNRRRIFAAIDACISGTLDAGMLHIQGRPAPGISIDMAEQAVWDELNRLKNEPVSRKELEKVGNRFESERVFSYMGCLESALALASLEMAGSSMEQEIRSYRAVSSADVQRVARQLFTRRNCCVLRYLKSKGSK